MPKWNLEALNERERACLGHLEQAKRLGVSFSRYCREKELSLHQWAWVKPVLVRKGVISERRRVEPKAVVGFAPVRVAPAAATMTTPAAARGCRIRTSWRVRQYLNRIGDRLYVVIDLPCWRHRWALDR